MWSQSVCSFLGDMLESKLPSMYWAKPVFTSTSDQVPKVIDSNWMKWRSYEPCPTLQVVVLQELFLQRVTTCHNGFAENSGATWCHMFCSRHASPVVSESSCSQAANHCAPKNSATWAKKTAAGTAKPWAANWSLVVWNQRWIWSCLVHPSLVHWLKVFKVSAWKSESMFWTCGPRKSQSSLGFAGWKAVFRNPQWNRKWSNMVKCVVFLHHVCINCYLNIFWYQLLKVKLFVSCWGDLLKPGFNASRSLAVSEAWPGESKKCVGKQSGLITHPHGFPNLTHIVPYLSVQVLDSFGPPPVCSSDFHLVRRLHSPPWEDAAAVELHLKIVTFLKPHCMDHFSQGAAHKPRPLLLPHRFSPQLSSWQPWASLGWPVKRRSLGCDARNLPQWFREVQCDQRSIKNRLEDAHSFLATFLWVIGGVWQKSSIYSQSIIYESRMDECSWFLVHSLSTIYVNSDIVWLCGRRQAGFQQGPCLTKRCCLGDFNFIFGQIVQIPSVDSK